MIGPIKLETSVGFVNQYVNVCTVQSKVGLSEVSAQRWIFVEESNCQLGSTEYPVSVKVRPSGIARIAMNLLVSSGRSMIAANSKSKFGVRPP